MIRRLWLKVCETFRDSLDSHTQHPLVHSHTFHVCRTLLATARVLRRRSPCGRRRLRGRLLWTPSIAFNLANNCITSHTADQGCISKPAFATGDRLYIQSLSTEGHYCGTKDCWTCDCHGTCCSLPLRWHSNGLRSACFLCEGWLANGSELALTLLRLPWHY